MKSDFEINSMDPLERQLWRFPLTTIFTLGVGVSVAGAVIWIWGISSAGEERRYATQVSLLVVAVLTNLLVLARTIEQRSLLPRGFRRLLYFIPVALFAGYLGFIVWILFADQGVGVIRMASGLMYTAPAIYLGWKLARDKTA
jgi:hypothetical protein